MASMGTKDTAATTVTADDYQRTTGKLAVVGIAGNCALTAFKLIAGIVGNSAAMVSDAIHSLSDVLATAIAYAGTKLGQKAPDESHPYGHDRFECLASILLGVILVVTGVGIGYGGVMALLSGAAESSAPSVIALVAAVVSILTKEAMFQYTRHHARRIKSSAFEADAWHHRSDAMSSVGALIGIGASMAGFHAGDAIAAIVICLFIFKVAWEVIMGAVNNLLDTPCGPETQAAIRTTLEAVPGIQRIDVLRTRAFGSKIFVDAEVALDGSLTLTQAHNIIEEAHDQVEQDFPDVRHIMIHPNPLQGEPSCGRTTAIMRPRQNVS
ncbi:MAG: cation diffusion facilitator family transporter [Coriobacteriia bacterium]|nr:cation diffusion facilitator family transporter [Coriobacteriia bacterium]